MKVYKLGYIEGNNVLEVKATIEEEKIEEFLEELKGINLNDYKKSKIVHQRFTGIVSPVECEYTNEDILNQFRTILNSKVIDYTKFIKLICSDSDLFNKGFVKLLNKFMDMFDYDLTLPYSKDEFSQLYRLTMNFGNINDKKLVNAMENSLVGNTRVISKFLNKDLFEKENKKTLTLLTKK